MATAAGSTTWCRDLEEVVSDTCEGEVIVVGLEPGLPADELNSGQPTASHGPAPDVEKEQGASSDGVEDQKIAHHPVVVLVDVVVPNANYREEIVKRSQERVEDEQEEEPLVLQAHTVIGEGAVVVHLEDTGLADGAVVGSSWLELIACVALAIPEST